MFIELKIKDYIVMHGFDSNNKEIEETFKAQTFTTKLIAVDRIQSVSEKFVLTTYASGRYIYWEYEGGLSEITKKLREAKLLL
ncbi:MAG: hypothetical protein AB7F43_12655 [Bacteriovoracia bacterium]